MGNETELGLVKATKSRLAAYEETKFGEHGVVLANLAQAKVWATEIAESRLAPKGLDTPGKVLLAVQTGMELGFTPMRALQAVVVVNGRATLMGEAALGLIRSSGQLEPGTDIAVGWRSTTEAEKIAGEGNLVGYCRTQRRGMKQNETLFSQEDAERARLWKKAGPWTEYPKRMLMWRSVAFHMRDYWSDIGNGLPLADEVGDYRPPPRDVTALVHREPPAASDPLMPDRPAETHPEPEPDDVIDAEWDESKFEAEGRVAESLDETGGFAPSESETSHDVLDANAEPPEDWEPRRDTDAAQ